MLTGLLFDDRGNRMSPSYTTKRGARYPFYVSSALLRGRKLLAGSVPRVSAAEIEAAVMIAIRSHIQDDDSEGLTPRDLVERNIDRVVVRAKSLQITLKNTDNITVPIEIKRLPGKRDLVQIDEGNGSNSDRTRNPELLQTIVRAHSWLKLLSGGKYASITALATAAKLHPKVIRNRIRLAFLAPTITNTILTGAQPAAWTLKTFNRGIPINWKEQHLVTLRLTGRH